MTSLKTWEQCGNVDAESWPSAEQQRESTRSALRALAAHAMTAWNGSRRDFRSTYLGPWICVRVCGMTLQSVGKHYGRSSEQIRKNIARAERTRGRFLMSLATTKEDLQFFMTLSGQD